MIMKVYIHKRNDSDGTGDWWEMVNEDFEVIESFYKLDKAKSYASQQGYEIIKITKQITTL